MALPELISLEQFRSQAQAILHPPFKSNFGFLRFRDLDLPGDELDYFVEDMLTSGEKSIIGGPSGSGKSFMALDISMAIATGRDFFGKKVKQGLVLYQAGEGARGIRNRLKAYREHHGIAANEDIAFGLLQKRIDLFAPEGDATAFIKEINEIRVQYDLPLRAVFIDTLSRAMGGANENDGRDIGAILNNIDRIRLETGTHVCLVHHLNADGTKLRGHTSLFANMDTVISVIEDPESKVRTVSLAKQKDGDTDFKTKFELISLKVGERDGKDVTSCVVLKTGEKEVFKNEGGEKPHRASPGETLMIHALLRALSESSVPPPSDIHCPESVNQVVEYDIVKNWFKRMNMRDDADTTKEQNRLSQALKRSRESLLTGGVIGNDQPEGSKTGWMWLTGKPVWGIKETYARRYRKPAAIAQPPTKVMRLADDDLPF